MDFASEYVLEEEEEEEEEEDDVAAGGIVCEAELDVANGDYSSDSGDDDGAYTGGFECEIMEFSDDEEARGRQSNDMPKKKKPKSSHMNTVNLPINKLRDEKPDMTFKEKLMYECANKRVCGAVLSHIDTPVDIEGSSDKKWVCRFCGVERTIREWPNFKIPDTPGNDILYTVDPDSPPDLTLNPGDNTVIFVLDTSGSMAQSVEPLPMGHMAMGNPMMNGIGGMNLFSQLLGGFGGGPMLKGLPSTGDPSDMANKTRLEAMREGIISELKKLKVNSPKTRVGVLYFNDEVTVLGDGSQAPVDISEHYLSDYSSLLTSGQRQHSLGYIQDSCDRLIASLEKLQEEGRTALGPALVVAMAMASKSKTSKVILCTDGYANVGLGRLEGGSMRETTQFYTDAGAYCKTQGVSVSLISFDKCGMAKDLGELPVETGGINASINPKETDLKIEDVLTRRTMATDAFVKFVVHKQLYVEDTSVTEGERSNLKKLVGNLHDEMRQAFRFGFRSDEKTKQERRDIKEVKGEIIEKPKKSSNVAGADATPMITEIKDADVNQSDVVPSATAVVSHNPDPNSDPSADSGHNGAEALPNDEELPFQVQIYYTDLNGVDATRVWTLTKPVTGNKTQAEEASNITILIDNLIQTTSKRFVDIFNKRITDVTISSEAKMANEAINKLLQKANCKPEESNKLNEYLLLVIKIMNTRDIDENVAEKLRNFQTGFNLTQNTSSDLPAVDTP